MCVYSKLHASCASWAAFSNCRCMHIALSIFETLATIWANDLSLAYGRLSLQCVGANGSFADSALYFVNIFVSNFIHLFLWDAFQRARSSSISFWQSFPVWPNYLECMTEATASRNQAPDSIKRLFTQTTPFYFCRACFYCGLKFLWRRETRVKIFTGRNERKVRLAVRPRTGTWAALPLLLAENRFRSRGFLASRWHLLIHSLSIWKYSHWWLNAIIYLWALGQNAVVDGTTDVRVATLAVAFWSNRSKHVLNS